MDGTFVSIPRRNAPSRTLEAQRVVPVFAFVLLISAGVAFLDFLLVRTANEHKSEAGTRLYEKGIAARRAGKSNEALELFRSAYNYKPRNPEYQLAFALALDTAGRVQEGRAALEGLLSRDPSHGAGNAEMARVLARTGDWQRAAWYYHRALYGQWTDAPDLQALRFELADLLARHQAREQLVSEVVLLDAQPADPAEARRLARLQLAAGEWKRAEALYRSLLRKQPEDPELLAGLARAQVGSGRYVAAERGLRRAIAAGASDPKVQQEFHLVSEVNAMDPTLRGLSAEEKHRRAHDLASTMLAEMQKCSPGNPLLVEAAEAAGKHQRTRGFDQSTESDLDLFERLWAGREQMCGATVELPQTLELLAGQLTK